MQRQACQSLANFTQANQHFKVPVFAISVGRETIWSTRLLSFVLDQASSPTTTEQKAVVPLIRENGILDSVCSEQLSLIRTYGRNGVHWKRDSQEKDTCVKLLTREIHLSLLNTKNLESIHYGTGTNFH